MKYLTIENHPNDSRVKIKDDEICQTLSSRMGTGGGNVPMVLEIEDETEVDINGSRGGVHDMEHTGNLWNDKITDGWTSAGCGDRG